MSTPPTAVAAVSAVALTGMPEVAAGDDLAALLVAACRAGGVVLGDQDVLVVASKVVAKAEGRGVAVREGRAGVADRERLIAGQSVRVVAERLLPDGRTTRVVQSRSGPVLAAAGIDASDVPLGTVLLLPEDADASARALRAAVAGLTGARPAVVVSDTAGRPWRDGVTDFALGAAGLAVLDDARGRLDRTGRVLEVTVRAVGDEVAALADLVKGKATGTPAAVVRGLGAHVTAEDGPGAAPLVRVGPGDWFAHGHVEAVRRALGVAVGVAVGGDDGAGEVPPAPIVPGGPLAERWSRALAVATAGRGSGAELVEGPATATATGDPYEVGAAVERVRVAAWVEGLAVDVERTPDGARLTPRPV